MTQLRMLNREQLKQDAEDAVQHCSQLMQQPTSVENSEVEEAKEELQRVNEVYWKIVHFDRWSLSCTLESATAQDFARPCSNG